MVQRPTSVTVLAILGIVFSALGFCMGIPAALLVLGGSQFLGPNPMMDKVNKDPTYLTFTIAALVFGVGINLLQLVAAFGSLGLRPWGRIGMLIAAVGTIISALANTVFSIAYVVPLMMQALPADGPERAGAMGGAIGGSCGGLLGLIYPVCVLYFFTRRHVIDAFRGIGPPADEDASRDRDRDEDGGWGDDRYRSGDDRYRT